MSKRFSMVPDEVASRVDLTPLAKLLYGLLLSRLKRRESDRPGVRKLAKRLGAHPDSCRRALWQLHSAGLIVVTVRGRGRSVHIRVIGPLSESDREIRSLSDREIRPLGGRDLRSLVGAERAQSVAAERAHSVRRDSERLIERERRGLHELTERLRLRLRTGHGIRASDRQLWQINPAFEAGVPWTLVYDRVIHSWTVSPPFEIASGLIREWARIKSTAGVLHRAAGGQAVNRPDQAALEALARWGTPELIAFAKGGPAPVANREAGDGGEGERPGGPE